MSQIWFNTEKILKAGQDPMAYTTEKDLKENKEPDTQTPPTRSVSAEASCQEAGPNAAIAEQSHPGRDLKALRLLNGMECP